MERYTVLTGDIVGSTDLSHEDLDRTMTALQTAAIEISGWGRDTVVGFARRAGDSWQIAFNRPAIGFRATLFCVAVLRRLAPDRVTRIAVSEGAGSLPPHTAGDLRDTNEAHGAAFTSSGRALDRMDKYTRLAHAGGGVHHALYRMADIVTEGWTQAQARAICEMLPPDPTTQAEAATRLGISRTAVQQALDAAGYRAILDAIKALETAE